MATDKLQASTGPISVSKPTFSGGEWAPNLYSSVTLDKYSSAARKLRNILVHPQGGASNRPGTYFVGTAKTFDDVLNPGLLLDKHFELIPFEFSTEQKYAIEAGDFYFRFFTTVNGVNGQILKATAEAWATATAYVAGDYVLEATVIYFCVTSHTSGTFATDLASVYWVAQDIYEIVSPYNETYVNEVQYAQSADILFTVHGKVKPKELQRFGNDDWRLIDYDFQGGPFMLNNTTDTTLRVSNGVSVDPYSIFLAHFDGTDAATTYNAETGQVLTFVGNAQLDTAQKKFGTASILLDGTGDYVTAPNDPIYDLGVGDFTVDFWVRWSTVASSCFFDINNGASTGIRLLLASAGTTLEAVIAGTTITASAASGPVNNTWYHVEIARSGTTLYFFLDGTQVGTTFSNSGNITGGTTGLTIGATNAGANPLAGWIDEFRITKGLARHTANFTPEVAQYGGQTSGVTLTSSEDQFDPLHVGGLWRLRHYIESAASSVSITATGVQASIKCGGTWRLITHGTWTAKFQVERSVDLGVTWQVVRKFSGAADANISTFQTDDNDGEPYLIRINTTAYTSGTLQADLTTDPFTQEGWFKTTGYTSPTVMTGEITREIGLTTVTKDWAEGSWSDFRGWPSSVSFAQDRLVFACTRTEPQTEWMTETGDYHSFRRHNPLVATDGISVPLPSRQLNAVNWLLPLGILISGTSSVIWTTGTADGVLTPTTVNTNPSDYYGAERVLPVIIGNRAMYVQVGGSVIRDLAYDFQSNGYVSTEISILATHLFKNYKIKRLVFQQNPNNTMWAIRSDGKMLSMTYLREQEVLAWTHHDTFGEFKTFCKLQGADYDELWLGVKRGTDNKRYIEKMANRMESTATADQFFVDCGVTYEGPPTQIITGLEHMEGWNVSILADGFVVAGYNNPKIVVGGQVDLGAEYSKVHVGPGYLADIETLNVEVALRTGTSQGKKVKISKITLQMQDSVGGLIGPNFDLLHEIGQSFSRYYTQSLGLFSGDFPENLGAGYEDGGRVCIRQADPLPLSILSLVPQVTVGGVSLVVA